MDTGWVRGAAIALATVLVSGIVVACGPRDSTTKGAAGCLASDEPLAVTLNEAVRDGFVSVWLHRPSEPRRLITGDWVASGPSFSPDGDRLAVTKASDSWDSGGPGPTDVWTMDRDGSHARQLTKAVAPERYDEAAWAPAGNDIAISHIVWTPSSSRGYIEIISTPGSAQPRRLTEPPDGTWDTAPAWSPDGKRIAYLRSARTVTSSPVYLRVMNRDGTNDHQVAEVDDFADTLDWSPNGQTLLVSPADLESPSAAIVDVETGAVQRIGNAADARWAGNGVDIHYIAPGSETQASLAQGHLVDNTIVFDHYVPGFAWNDLYGENGLAVDRCA
jgi:Tol biopolymer transport system component